MNYDAILTLIKLHPTISLASLPLIGATLWHIVLANWKKLLPMALKIVLRWMKREDVLRIAHAIDDVADETIKDLNAATAEKNFVDAMTVEPVAPQLEAVK